MADICVAPKENKVNNEHYYLRIFSLYKHTLSNTRYNIQEYNNLQMCIILNFSSEE